MNPSETFAAAFLLGMVLYGTYLLVEKVEEAERRSRAIVTDTPKGESMMEKFQKDRAEFDAKVERLVVAVESLATQGATE